jgi:hypothetical protein
VLNRRCADCELLNSDGDAVCRRQDCCKEKLSNFYVLLSKQSFSSSRLQVLLRTAHTPRDATSALLVQVDCTVVPLKTLFAAQPACMWMGSLGWAQPHALVRHSANDYSEPSSRSVD